MKEPEYRERPKAKEEFERPMVALFQVPRPADEEMEKPVRPRLERDYPVRFTGIRIQIVLILFQYFTHHPMLD